MAMKKNRRKDALTPPGAALRMTKRRGIAFAMRWELTASMDKKNRNRFNWFPKGRDSKDKGLEQQVLDTVAAFSFLSWG